MSKHPNRKTVAGRAYLDLRKLARSQQRPTSELLQLYALEGFLSRLAASSRSEEFVLKGGTLLAAFNTRRPTKDIDLQAQETSNDGDTMKDIMMSIAEISLDDGLRFDTDNARVETIRDEDSYSGIRVSFQAFLATARLNLHVDINVGDPIWPAPQQISLPRVLEGYIQLMGYPLPMVFAEKIVTAVQRGTVNTRWRDFADIYLLCQAHDVNGTDLTESIEKVAKYREAQLKPLETLQATYPREAQPKWGAWRRKQRLEEMLPPEFSAVLETIVEFSDPALQQRVRGHEWQAPLKKWTFG